MLAMEQARDNRDFYGRRYAGRELVWEVLSQEESEDYYDIRLSYRPIEGFRGAPGHEQFTIDKAGPIRLRQIIRQPQPSRRAAYVLGIAVVLAAIGAIAGGLFAFGAISITPDASARLVSSDGGVTIDVAAGTVGSLSRLSYGSLSGAEIPMLPQQYRATGTAFDLTAEAVLPGPASSK